MEFRRRSRPFVPLEREFWAVRREDSELEGPEGLLVARMSGKVLHWTDLLERQAVVVLAEAGAGKTQECKERVHALRLKKGAAFFVAVEDLAQRNLHDALGQADTEALGSWQAGAAQRVDAVRKRRK